MADGFVRRDRMQPSTINRGPNKEVNPSSRFTRYNPTPIIATSVNNTTRITATPGTYQHPSKPGSTRPTTSHSNLGPQGPQTLNCDITGVVGCGPPAFATIDWGINLLNVETNLNGGGWTALGCGVTAPQTITGVANGDNIQVRGICNVDINVDTTTTCGGYNISPLTNIYVFYDVTSMSFNTAKEARDAIEDWAATTITAYSGNVYHIPVLHERYILWPQYPLTGTLPPYYQVNYLNPPDVTCPDLDGDGIPDCGKTGWDPVPGNDTTTKYVWQGPLVTGGVDEMNAYNRPAWDLASDGVTPFYRLPQNGDLIPNWNGTGPATINSSDSTAPQPANLGDIPTNGSGHLDCGGSRATWSGGDVDALVVCLSDEAGATDGAGATVSQWYINMHLNANDGHENGYHGNINDGQNGTPDCSLFNLLPKNVAEAKSHYYIWGKDRCRRYPTDSDPLVSTQIRCDYSTNPSTLLNNNGCKSGFRYNLNAYDWNKGIAGSFYRYPSKEITPSYTCSTCECLGRLNSVSQWFPHYGDVHRIGSGGAVYQNSGWDKELYYVETRCGQYKCGNASDYRDGYCSGCGSMMWDGVTSASAINAINAGGSGTWVYNCDFEILSAPTPGWIADYKFHMESVYGPHISTYPASQFSTFFYAVSRGPQAGIQQAALIMSAGLEGVVMAPYLVDTMPSTSSNNTAMPEFGMTTYGNFAPLMTGASFNPNAPDYHGCLACNGNGSTSGLPTVPTVLNGIVDALAYYNPYADPKMWHPNDSMGWDPWNSAYYKTSLGGEGLGLKHYMHGDNGKCGYNISREEFTTADINTDLTSFISTTTQTGCQGNQDCITIQVIDQAGSVVPNYTFDFNGSNVTTDAAGQYITAVNPGNYNFLCNNFTINTSPIPAGDHTSTVSAAPGSAEYGCNAWEIVMTLEEKNIPVTLQCGSGCTDGTGAYNPSGTSAACNYDPTVTIDDGSCIYADCMDMCPDPVVHSYTAYSHVSANVYPNSKTYPTFPYHWQSGGGDAYFDQSCSTCCVGGLSTTVPTDCVDCLGQCGGNAEYDECGECNGNNESKDDCGVCFGDNECVDCMDCTAINYNPQAIIPCQDCCIYPEWECKMKEVARKVLETCETGCDPYYQELYTEASMLYSSVLILDEQFDCQFDCVKIHSIYKSLHRLLSKIECGVCRNC